LQSVDQSFGLWTHRLGGINEPLETQASLRIEDPEDPLTVHQADGFDAGVGNNLRSRSHDHILRSKISTSKRSPSAAGLFAPFRGQLLAGRTIDHPPALRFEKLGLPSTLPQAISVRRRGLRFRPRRQNKGERRGSGLALCVLEVSQEKENCRKKAQEERPSAAVPGGE
jgi:hypothetical protein